MFEDSDAICPYFKRMYRAKGKAFVNRIACEGLVNGTNNETIFTHKGQAEKFKCVYCDTHYYQSCPMAKAITKYKYKE